MSANVNSKFGGSFSRANVKSDMGVRSVWLDGIALPTCFFVNLPNCPGLLRTGNRRDNGQCAETRLISLRLQVRTGTRLLRRAVDSLLYAGGMDEVTRQVGDVLEEEFPVVQRDVIEQDEVLMDLSLVAVVGNHKGGLISLFRRCRFRAQQAREGHPPESLSRTAPHGHRTGQAIQPPVDWPTLPARVQR